MREKSIKMNVIKFTLLIMVSLITILANSGTSYAATMVDRLLVPENYPFDTWGGTSPIGNGRVNESWYYVVTNTESAAMSIGINIYGATAGPKTATEYLNQCSSHIIATDNLPAGVKRMYIYTVYTGYGSNETVELASVDITLNSNGVITNYSDNRTLIAIMFGSSDSGQKDIRYPLVENENEVLKKHEYKIYGNSNKVIEGQWVQSDGTVEIIKFDDNWSNPNGKFFRNAAGGHDIPYGKISTLDGSIPKEWFFKYEDSRVTVTEAVNGNYCQRPNEKNYNAGRLTLTVPDMVVKAIPTANTTSFTYNTAGQIPTFNNYDSAYMTMSGTTTAQVNANTYSTTFSLNNTATTKWSDGTNTPKTIYWTINKAAGSISYGTTTVTKTYGNTAFTNTLTKTGDGTVKYKSSNTGVATVDTSGAVTIVGVGSAIITATVTDGTNYTYATKTASYTLNVSKASITPTVSMSGYTYGGTKSNPSISGNTSGGTVTYYYNTSNSNSGGTAWTNVTSATSLNAGTYYMYAKVAETANYNLGTSTAVSFTISKANGRVTLSATSGSIAYGTTSASFTASGTGILSVAEITNTAASPSISGNTVVIGATGGLASGTTVTVRVTAAESTNYKQASKDYTLTIGTTTGSISYGTTTVTKTYGYGAFTNPLTKVGDGAVTYSSDNTDVATVNTSGAVTIVGAGSTTITATVTNSANYTYATKTASYTLNVNKAPGSVTVSPISIELSSGGSAKTATVTRAGNGAISVSSENANVATASLIGTTVTISPKGVGSAIITVSVNEGSNHTAPSAATIKVTVVDATAPGVPTITAKHNNANGAAYTSGAWTNGNVYIKLSSTDNVGISKYQYQLNSTTGTWKDISATGEIIFDSAMDATVYFRAIDTSSNNSLTSSIVIRINKSTPTVSRTIERSVHTDFSAWTFTGGAYVDGSGNLVLPSVGARVASSYIPVDSTKWLLEFDYTPGGGEGRIYFDGCRIL